MRGNTSVFITFIIGALSMVAMAKEFHIDLVEYNRMRMIFTGGNHYAIYNPDFKFNWQAFSFNGDTVLILGRDNKTVTRSWSSLTKEQQNQAAESKRILNEIRSGNPNAVTGDLVRVSTYDLHGSVSSAGHGGKASTSSMSVNGMSVSKTGDSDYVISKNDLPYRWIRLFINDKIVGTVNRDGVVLMNHMHSMTSDERKKLEAIMEPIKKMDSFQKNMMKSISNPMDFVSRAMGGLFGK